MIDCAELLMEVFKILSVSLGEGYIVPNPHPVAGFDDADCTRILRKRKKLR